MLIKCKNCKYWENTTSERGKQIMGFLLGKCHCPDFVIGFESDATRSNQLVYCDSEGLDVYLGVGEDFGCINAKPIGD